MLWESRAMIIAAFKKGLEWAKKAYAIVN